MYLRNYSLVRSYGHANLPVQLGGLSYHATQTPWYKVDLAMKTFNAVVLLLGLSLAGTATAAPLDARCFRSSFLTPLDTVEFYIEHLNAGKPHQAESALATDYDEKHDKHCDLEEKFDGTLTKDYSAEAYKVHRKGSFNQAEVTQWNEMDSDRMPEFKVGDVDMDIEIFRANGSSDMNTFVTRKIGREWFILYRYSWADTNDYYAADIPIDAEPLEDFRPVPEFSDEKNVTRLFR